MEQGRAPHHAALQADEAESIVALLVKHVSEPVPGFDTLDPALKVPDGVGALLDGLLEKDPANRIQSAKAVRSICKRLLGDISGSNPAVVHAISGQFKAPSGPIPTVADRPGAGAGAKGRGIDALGKTYLSTPRTPSKPSLTVTQMTGEAVSVPPPPRRRRRAPGRRPPLALARFGGRHPRAGAPPAAPRGGAHARDGCPPIQAQGAARGQIGRGGAQGDGFDELLAGG